MKNKLLENIIFYVVVSLPAYALIIYGLRGMGLTAIYGYPNYPMQNAFDLINFTPDPSFAIYFLIAGLGIIFGMIYRGIMKYRRN